MKTKSILARHPLGLILELIGLVSVAIMLGKPVALAQVGPSSAIAWGAPQDITVPADYDGARLTDETGYARLFHALLDRGVALAPGAYEVLFPGLAHTDEVLKEIAAAATSAAGAVRSAPIAGSK